MANPSAIRLAEDKKAAIDIASFVTNVLVSVLIVFVNKLLMDPKHGYGFVFATTLCALHFFVSGFAVWTAEGLGYSQPAKLPRKGMSEMLELIEADAVTDELCGLHLSHADTLYFSLIAGTSISTLNLSLLVNSVGFYQVRQRGKWAAERGPCATCLHCPSMQDVVHACTVPSVRMAVNCMGCAGKCKQQLPCRLCAGKLQPHNAHSCPDAFKCDRLMSLTSCESMQL